MSREGAGHTSSVVGAVRGGAAAWFYLDDGPRLVLVDRAKDPKKADFKARVEAQLSDGPAPQRQVRGMLRHRSSGFQFVARKDFADFIPLLARWAAERLEAFPELVALRESSYVWLGPDKRPVRVDRDPEAWAGMNSGEGTSAHGEASTAQGPASASSTPTETTDAALDGVAAASVAVLEQGIQSMWLYVAETPDPARPALVVTSKKADPEARAYKAAVRTAVRAGAVHATSIRGNLAAGDGRLRFSSKKPVPELVGRLVRWAQVHGTSASVRTLLDLRVRLLESDGEASSDDDADAWAPVRGRAEGLPWPLASETLAALSSESERFWFVLTDTLAAGRPIVALMAQGDKPDDEALNELCLRVRRAGGRTTGVLVGTTVQMDGRLTILSEAVVPGSIGRLAAWAEAHAEHPQVSGLVDARYLVVDESKTVLLDERVDATWDSLRRRYFPERRPPEVEDTLSSLARQSDQYWVLVGSPQGGGPPIVRVVDKRSDPKGASFGAVRRRAPACAHSVSAVATRGKAALRLVGRDDETGVVDWLAAWAEQYAEHPGVRVLLGATYELRDENDKRVRLESSETAWAGLRERFAALDAQAAQERLAQAAADSSGEPADTVAVLRAAEAMQWHWFWLCDDGEAVHLVVRDADSDPKRELFEQAVLAVRKDLPPGFREGVGKAAQLATGTWDFRTRSSFDGATRAMKRWVERWESSHPGVRVLVGAPYLQISAEGHVQREQLWPTASAPKTPTAPPSTARPLRRPTATASPARPSPQPASPAKPAAPAPPAPAKPAQPVAPAKSAAPASPAPAKPAQPVVPAKPAVPAQPQAHPSAAAPPAAAVEPSTVAAPTAEAPVAEAAEPAAPTGESLTAHVRELIDEVRVATGAHGPQSNPRDLMPIAELLAAAAAQAEQTVLSLHAAGLLCDGGEGSESLELLAAAEGACTAWIQSVRGPPFATRNPIEIPLPESMGSLSVDDRRQSCAAAHTVAGQLGRVASKLNQYQSYRSSFPPAMKAGFDARVGELVERFHRLTELVAELCSAQDSS